MWVRVQVYFWRDTVSTLGGLGSAAHRGPETTWSSRTRSEEHTSELQSLTNLVCRLLLEKKKQRRRRHTGGENSGSGDIRPAPAVDRVWGSAFASRAAESGPKHNRC